MKLKEPTIFVTQPFLPPIEEFIPYLQEIWERKWITNNGHFHQLLEEELSRYLGVKYLSLFTNGTLALITALQALRIAGEVITTPFSFVATTHALWWNGIKPVFVDIEPDFFNIDPAKIEAAITTKTSAILPVHVYGNPCNVDELKEIADTYGLKVIYDACHTFGVTLNGESVLNFGDLSVMSFHATKVFTTFEGGAIISHDEATKRRIDNLKNFGFVDGKVVAPGINAKVNELQAAMGLLQLKYIDTNIEKRKDIANYYRENFRNMPGVKYLEDSHNVRHCYSYFPVVIEKEQYGLSRDDLFDKLVENGIVPRKYFFPLISNFPMYRTLDSARRENLPVAERISSNILCLPIYPELEKETLKRIINIVGSPN